MRLAWLLVLFGLTTGAFAPSTALSAPPDYPAFRVLGPEGEPSLIIGSLHQGDARVPLPSPSLLDHAHRLVIEGDPTLPQPPSRPDLPAVDETPPLAFADILDPH
jgi:uncharacterized protein YbaP (TraB family)